MTQEYVQGCAPSVLTQIVEDGHRFCASKSYPCADQQHCKSSSTHWKPKSGSGSRPARRLGGGAASAREIHGRLVRFDCPEDPLRWHAVRVLSNAPVAPYPHPRSCVFLQVGWMSWAGFSDPVDPAVVA